MFITDHHAGKRVAGYRRYSETEVASCLEMSLATLRRIRRAGRISFIQISERKIAFFGFQVLTYLLEQAEGSGCQTIRNATFNSASSISPREAIARPGAGPSSTLTLGKRDALASARRILNKPSKP